MLKKRPSAKSSESWDCCLWPKKESQGIINYSQITKDWRGGHLHERCLWSCYKGARAGDSQDMLS